jgi:hypothetical protein
VRVVTFKTVVIGITLCLLLMTISRFVNAQTEIRGKNPPRVEWKDASKAYTAYKAGQDTAFRALITKTHDLFHGSFDGYFSQLPTDSKKKLIEEFGIVLDDAGIKSTISFADVFRIPATADVLFPLQFGQDEQYGPGVLQDLMLRTKSGQEKGRIKSYRAEHQEVFGTPIIRVLYSVAMSNGQAKDENFRLLERFGGTGFNGSDDVTVRWSELAQRPLMSQLSLTTLLQRYEIGRIQGFARSAPISTEPSGTIAVPIGTEHVFDSDGVAVVVQLTGKAAEDYLWNHYELKILIKNGSKDLLTFDSLKIYAVDDRGLALYSNTHDVELIIDRSNQTIQKGDEILSDIDRLTGRTTRADLRDTKTAVEDLNRKTETRKPTVVPPGANTTFTDDFHTPLNAKYIMLSVLGIQGQTKPVNVVMKVMLDSMSR